MEYQETPESREIIDAYWRSTWTSAEDEKAIKRFQEKMDRMQIDLIRRWFPVMQPEDQERAVQTVAMLEARLGG